ncbi:MAG: hypothetical protein Q4G58_12885 [bacterium]|nr:hypothetical protein [bacterium]
MKIDFEENSRRRKKVVEEYSRRDNYLGIFKLPWVILMIYGIYNVYSRKVLGSMAVLLLGEIIVFIIVCKFHEKIKERIRFEKAMIDINQRNEKRMNGEWTKFKDIGEEFIDHNHPYAMDLDVVGTHSLFQYLNSTQTDYGRRRFANDLLYAQYRKKELKERQQAILELSKQYDWTSRIEYLFSKIGRNQKVTQFIKEIQNPRHFLPNRLLQGLVRVIWIPTVSLLLLALLFFDTVSLRAALVLVGLQLLVTMLCRSFVKAYIGVLNTLPKNFLCYNELLNELSKMEFYASRLVQIKQELTEARQAFKELFKLVEKINQSHNLIAAFLLNGFALWNIRNAIALDAWKQQYSKKMEEWFQELGELESIMSFSNLPRVCRTVSLPEYVEQKRSFSAKGLGHPLIEEEKRVCNDFSLEDSIYIISGSNMSGKTTFMRTVGINLILAQAGSFVCARGMVFSKLKVITSMRVADDVKEGISTFYAELLRIKKIVDQAHKDKRTLFLIDEIFRGTNSIDRLKGAEGVLEELSKANVVGMITTHDLDVCNLEKFYNNIRNVSFHEQYVNGEIRFDYKLKYGRSKTTNAQFLLKKVGIIK